MRIVGINATEKPAHSIVRHNIVPAENGQVFTIAFWAKVDAQEGQSREVNVSARMENGPWPGFHNNTIILDSTDWKEYTDTFVVPSGSTNNIWVGLAVAISEVDFWLDDFRFFKGEPADEIKEPAGVKGDVNGDGVVRSNDAITALRIVAGLIAPTDDQEWAADVNDDGRISSNDAMFILRKVAGLPIQI